MLWWSGLLYRGGAALQTTGDRVLYCHDPDLCIWIQYAGILQSAVYIFRFFFL